MKRLGWLLLLLFFFPSSSIPLRNPFQTPLQNSMISDFKEDQSATNRGVLENGFNKIGIGEEIRRVRLQGHAGGHGGGGHGHAGGYGGGGGVMSHHNNDKDNRHIRRANSCTTNRIRFLHLTFQVLPILFII